MHVAKYLVLGFTLVLMKSFAVPKVAQEPQAARQVGEGTIQKFMTNPEGEIDGFLLDGGQLVHFPPSLSPLIAETVKIGDVVKLEGEKLADGELRASAITDVKDNVRVVEKTSGPHAARRHEAMKAMKVQGRIARIFLGPSQDIKQVLLSDGSQIRVPREAAVAMRGEFKEGSAFAAEGLGTENQFGRSLEATAIGTSLGTLTPIFGKAAPSE